MTGLKERLDAIKEKADALQKEAWNDGYKAGHADGWDAGLDAAREIQTGVRQALGAINAGIAELEASVERVKIETPEPGRARANDRLSHDHDGDRHA